MLDFGHMSTPDDRLAVQAKMQVDDLATETAEWRRRFERQIADMSAAVNKRFDSLSARFGILGIVVSLATVGLPVWGSLQASQSKSVSRDQAAAVAEQRFNDLAEKWQARYQYECRARDKDLEYMAEKAADRAAVKAVGLAHMPQERITP